MSTHGQVEQLPPRFFCVARWRCRRCDSPWLGTRSIDRARELLNRHLGKCNAHAAALGMEKRP